MNYSEDNLASLRAKVDRIKSELEAINEDDMRLHKKKDALLAIVAELKGTVTMIYEAETGRGDFYHYYSDPLHISTEVSQLQTAALDPITEEIDEEQARICEAKLGPLLEQLQEAEDALKEYQEYADSTISKYDKTRKDLNCVNHQLMLNSLNRIKKRYQLSNAVKQAKQVEQVLNGGRPKMGK